MGTAIKRSWIMEIKVGVDTAGYTESNYFRYPKEGLEELKPNLPACEMKYWKDDGGLYPVEMTTQEKADVDAQIQAEQDAKKLAAEDINNVDPVIKTAFLEMFDYGKGTKPWPANYAEFRQNIIDRMS